MRFLAAARTALAAAFAAAFLLYAAPGMADQSSVCMPTVGTVSGLTFSQDVTSGLAAVLSTNAGNSAPSNDCSAAAVKGQLWINTTSSTVPTLEIFDGANWQIIGTVNVSTHQWQAPLGGGAATVASASTASIWTAAGSYLTISGSTTISSFGSGGTTGEINVLTFTGTPILTYNATSMILPTGASIHAAVGDKAIVAYLGGSNAAVIAYQRADGTALAVSSTPNFTGDSGSGGAAGLVPAPPAGSAADAQVLGAGGAWGVAMPVGTVLDFAGSSTPTGFLLCSGQAVSRTTYSVLFAVIGTTYGVGNGTTTFNVPDGRGRVVAGQDDMGGTSANRLTSPLNGDTLGGAGGSQSHAITTAEMPAHTHSFSASASITGTTTVTVTSDDSAFGSNHATQGNIDGKFFNSSGDSHFGGPQSMTGSGSVSGTASMSGTTGSAGSGTAATIVQPTIIMNMIIKY